MKPLFRVAPECYVIVVYLFSILLVIGMNNVMPRLCQEHIDSGRSGSHVQLLFLLIEPFD